MPFLSGLMAAAFVAPPLPPHHSTLPPSRRVCLVARADPWSVEMSRERLGWSSRLQDGTRGATLLDAPTFRDDCRAKASAPLTAALAAGDQVSHIFEACENSAELRRRYRSLAAAFHPDRAGGNAETFQCVVDAYERRLRILAARDPLDAEIRQALDELGEVLSSLTERAVANAIGEEAYKSVATAARTGWAMVAGLSRNLLGGV